MTINERYRICSKHSHIKRCSKLYILIPLIFLFSFTMARYTQSSDIQLEANIAKWNILINGTNVIFESSDLELEILDMNGLPVNNILPGDAGYFDITINPVGTEVSVQYTINVDYELIPGMQISGENLIDNQIIGQIKINEEEFTSKTYRVYWSWSGSEEIKSGTPYAIAANVQVKQLID